MKKQAVRVLMIAGLFSVLTLASVSALPSGAANFDIPFNFIVRDGVTLPAGQYNFQSMSSIQGVILIRSANGHGQAMLLTHSVQARDWQKETKLVFKRYGDKYVLCQLWTAGDSTGRQFPTSRVERQLARRGPKDETVIIVARNQ